jgi:hypothetical protein
VLKFRSCALYDDAVAIAVAMEEVQPIPCKRLRVRELERTSSNGPGLMRASLATERAR